MTAWIKLTLVAGILAALCAAVAGVFYAGKDYGLKECAAAAQRDAALADAAANAVTDRLSGIVSNIKITNKTIVQKVQREIEIRPEYRDCRHDSGMLNTINSALTGGRAGAPSAGGAGVPEQPGAAGQRYLRGDVGQAGGGGGHVLRMPRGGAGSE